MITSKPARVNEADLHSSPATSKERMLKPHEVALSATAQNAISVKAWSNFAGEIDLAATAANLREQVRQVQVGDLGRVEAMLYGQALALQTIFTSLARKAAAPEHLEQFQVNLTLALKAQAQSRATLAVLAEIKNPRPVSFVQQANIANGAQQVNNGSQPNSRPREDRHEEKTDAVKNELLESLHGNSLDTGTQGRAGRADQTVEAVAARDGAAHDGRQG